MSKTTGQDPAADALAGHARAETRGLDDEAHASLLARLAFLEFSNEDAAILSQMHEGLCEYQTRFGERFYAHLNSFPALKPFLQEPVLARLQHSQSSYFSLLSAGRYDLDYVRNRIRVGVVHQRIGLKPEWYLGAYRKYIAELTPVIWRLCGQDFSRFEQAFGALSKVIFFDIGIALETYFDADREMLAQAREQLVFQATHDELTALPNRTLLEDRVQQALLEAQRHSSAVSLLLLDIDHFQNFNDTYGYAAGDHMLKEVALRLQKCVQDRDTVSRYVGNKFALILKGLDRPRRAAAACEHLLQVVAQPYEQEGRTINLTCSIGIALHPQDGADVDSLLRSAHLALHRAKTIGRNNYQFYCSEINQRMIERGSLESALRQALERDELTLHYQPQADLRTGTICGIEALLRWRHPEHGEITREQLIDLADECGLGTTVGLWVLRRACTDMQSWRGAGLAVPRLCVNISRKQFSDALVVHQLEQLLTELGIDSSLMTLEITESALMQDPDASESTLRRLKQLGIFLALDDFGTGFSSLSYLKRFPLDLVKIDESFIHKGALADAGAISDAIISMAHSLGIKVIAEGVETESQCDYLRQHMCDEIQGHFFCPPLPAAEVPALLRESRVLPAHLLRLQEPTRTLLLVDDESNILSALRRLLRRDGYHILTAGSGAEGLEVLAQHAVDVIVSDQRMPGMMGVEFLREAKSLHPDTVRIVLSGYTELQSVTDAINEGAVYRFLTKPWEDQQLREHIAEAFRHKEMADENRRLNLRVLTANQELAAANRQLEQVLQQKQQQISRDEISLNIVREVLQHIPLPMLAIDDEGMIAFFNAAAEALFAQSGSILGDDASTVLPEIFEAVCRTAENEVCLATIERQQYRITWRAMGRQSQSRGKLISLTHCPGEAP